jgi:poly(hydroxyalkanoate) depolymerase family esterase
MIPLNQIDMAEATRLTREGRLDEAMALLRGTRPDAKDEGGAEVGTRRARPARPVLDMVPPSPGTGGVWTAPGVTPGGAAPRGLGGLAGGKWAMPDPLAARGAAKPAMPLPPGARFENRVHVGASGSRPYRLYVPGAHAGRPLPLVVMLHGCTQSPEDFAAGTRMNEVAEEVGLLVAYPEQTRAANASLCWNWFSAAEQRRDAGEPALIAGIAREVLREPNADPSRVYVAGLSAGGAAAAIMGDAYPELFAAVGVHSGLACGAASDMAQAFAAMRQGGAAALPGRTGEGVPTIVFHGSRDATVSPVNGDEVIGQAKAEARLKAAVERGRSPGGMEFTRTVHTDAEGRARLEHWLLHGAGHAWSGGSAAGSYTDPRGPDASREMVRFFQEIGPRAG